MIKNTDRAIPTYGKLMTVHDFYAKCVFEKEFTESNGNGYYTNGDVYNLDDSVNMSNFIHDRDAKSSLFEYVVWFTK